MKIQAAILVFDGVEELDFIAPFEVLSAASKLGADIQVHLVSPQAGTVAATHGLLFESSRSLDSAFHYDVLIVPGGAWISGADTGVRRAVRDERMIGFLRATAEQGGVVASVCTGAFLLAAAGLLAGIPAVTHHLASEDLRALGIETVHARIVDAGSIVTAGGVASGLDLALWLVERFFGDRSREGVEDYLEYRMQGKIHRAA